MSSRATAFLKGRKMVKNVRRTSHRLTFNEAVQIHKRIWTGEIYRRIAPDYDVNIGHISEVNTGKLHPGSREVAMRS